MNRVFRVYDSYGKLVCEDISPVTIPNLTSGTTYATGAFVITAVENDEESYWVPIPEFRTLTEFNPAPQNLKLDSVTATSVSVSWEKGV